MNKNRIRTSFTFLVAVVPAFAQSTWNDTSTGDPDWSNAANWSSGTVPGSTTDVIIGAAPTAGIIGLNDGGNAITVKSLTVNSGIGAFSFVQLAGESLAVNGSITNNDSGIVDFQVAVNAGANSTWSGPLNFGNNVVIGTRQVTLSGTQIFSGSNLNFEITNATTHGSFLGSGTTTFNSTVQINIGGSYTGTLGNSFDFTTGNFGSAVIGNLSTLSAGLSWDTSQFLNNGILTVVSAVPEPATYATLFGLGVLGLAAYRRRRPVV